MSVSPSDLLLDQKKIQRAKDDLLASGVLNSPVLRPGVRDVIDRSWRRCVVEAVPTSQAPAVYRGDPGPQSTLRAAAAPVLARLSEHLADVRVAMFLTDANGNILIRKANEARQRDQLDNASAAEGFDFSERSIGTNGLGTVLEERQPILVRGSEHFNDALAPLACAGTPIFEPFTRRIVGSFALASNAEDASPFMYGIATDVGRQIESNLTTMLGSQERALIRSYLVANQTKRDPVIVVNERTVFANTAGLAYLDSESHAMLWTQLDRAPLQKGPQRIQIPLLSGWHDAEVEQVEGSGGAQAAYCVRILSEQPSEKREPERKAGNRAARTSLPDAPVHQLRDIDAQLSIVAQHRECLSLVGKPGTGKMHTASRFLDRYYNAKDPLILDISMTELGEGADWIDTAVKTLESGRGVILRHLQDLDPRDSNRVKAIAEHSQAHIPFIVTVDLDDAPAHIHALVNQSTTRVPLPELRELGEQIPTLVNAVLSRMSGVARTTRFSSEAHQLLMRWSWPGNIAELARTIEHCARRKPGRIVEAADIPVHIRQAGSRRALGMIESAERDAIVKALRQHDGNRSKAAAALGIGRTTLYRKMQSHRIDG